MRPGRMRKSLSRSLMTWHRSATLQAPCIGSLEILEKNRASCPRPTGMHAKTQASSEACSVSGVRFYLAVHWLGILCTPSPTLKRAPQPATSAMQAAHGHGRRSDRTCRANSPSESGASAVCLPHLPAVARLRSAHWTVARGCAKLLAVRNTKMGRRSMRKPQPWQALSHHQCAHRSATRQRPCRRPSPTEAVDRSRDAPRSDRDPHCRPQEIRARR